MYTAKLTTSIHTGRCEIPYKLFKKKTIQQPVIIHVNKTKVLLQYLFTII